MQRLEAFLAQFENPYLLAVAIIIGGMIVARIVVFITTGVLGALVAKTETDADDKALTALRRPLIMTVVLLSVHLAVHRLPILEQTMHYVTSAMQTIAILVWAKAILVVAQILLLVLSQRARTKDLIQPRTLPVFDIFGKVLVWSLAIYFVFLAWNIDLTAWLASAGILGIAIGFAAKDTLANLFSGLFIVADAPYEVGHYIVLENELRGRVLSIGLRSTRMLTMDGVEITVPNGIIGNGMIINETGGPSISHRISVTVDAAYGSDIDTVHETLAGVPTKMKNILETPAPAVLFREFGASGLTHTLHVWIHDARLREEVTHDLHTTIYKEFEKAEIEIPYSKHDVYIKEFPAAKPVSEAPVRKVS
ncbi:MAG: MscS family membrane protein [Polyangiales bacterium]|jgi:MscS family membrane protein